MARSLAKIQKKIIRKRGNINSLHENSRDSQRLQRASTRGEKLRKVAAERARARAPFLERLAFLQTAITQEGNPTATLDLEKTHSLIQKFLNRHDEELAQLQSERRPGRPSHPREDALKQRMSQEEKEYSAGFWIPDMQDEDSVQLLRSWKGEWSALSLLKFVRLTCEGVWRQSTFPPNGKS